MHWRTEMHRHHRRERWEGLGLILFVILLFISFVYWFYHFAANTGPPPPRDAPFISDGSLDITNRAR
jgi:hypothetical protein